MLPNSVAVTGDGASSDEGGDWKVRKDGSSSGYGGDAASPGNGGGIMFPRRVGGNFPGDGVDKTVRGFGASSG